MTATASPLRRSFLPQSNGHVHAHANGHAYSNGDNNDEHLYKPWIVQKFGGTSIGKFIETITGTIV
ncbi:hypothetical protein BGZ92_005800, partial [Podila epicladia]